MNADAQSTRLGKGLAALIGDVDQEKHAVERARGSRKVPVEFLSPNPNNPRRAFGEEELGDLANSIAEKGIVQPIIARPARHDPERFEIVAGERRWRAAQKAGLHEVPVIVQRIDDREALEIAIIENVQRSDLNPLEEAAGYQQLQEEFTYTQTELAKVIGKSRSHVANTMRLLKLPETVRAWLADGSLSAGHARTLVGHPEPERLARIMVEQRLNVRDAEELVRKPSAKGASSTAPSAKDADTLALEKRISDALGLKFDIRHKDSGGEVRIGYKTLEQLEEICRRLGRS